jgi:organic hydroperoxide reductase OsmC/OhrA
MEAEMARVLYTAEATVTGGRANGHGRTDDGALDVQLRSPNIDVTLTVNGHDVG